MLDRIKAAFPGWPLLVQHGQTRKRHEWPCGCAEPVYLRGVRPNEVYLENDSATYEEQREAVQRIRKYLGPEFCLVAWSGGKSFHVSFLFDPDTLPALDDIDTAKVDVLKVVRLFLFHEIPRRAGVALEYDLSNVNWTVLGGKTGHMVRWAGSVKPDAKPGTTPFTYFDGDIPAERPSSMEWSEPKKMPPVWPIPEDLRKAILDACAREQEAVLRREDERGEVTDERIQEMRELYGVGGWRRLVPEWTWLDKGAIWSPGQRNPRATMCIRAMGTYGLTVDEITAELKKLEAHVDDDGYDFQASWYGHIGDKIGNPIEVSERVFEDLESDARVDEMTRKMRDKVAPSVFVHESPLQEEGLAIDIDIDEIPKTLTPPPATPSSLSFTSKIIEEAKRKSAVLKNLTDTGNAERLIYRFGDNFRFVYMGTKKGKYVVWDGERWRFDDGAHMLLFSIANARMIPDEVEGIDDAKIRNRVVRHAETSESEGKLNAAANIARLHKVDLEQFDSNPWLLNVENGTLDLQTGEFRNHRREDLLMHMAGVRYEPKAKCPNFEKYLEKVFPDPDIREHLQRFVGYSLTGHMGERVFRVDWGQLARNGKSTLYRTMRKMLGDYAITVTFETFSADRAGTIRNDLAAIAGKRLVLAIESATKFELDVNLIKSISGGDEQQARFLFLEYFNFYPKCKLWMASNNKAAVTEGSNAIWDRMHLVEWKVRISDEEEIKDYAEKFLFPELPGILNWAIEGCRKWQRNGFRPLPEEITEAVDMYRREEYVLQGFIDDCCAVGDGLEEPFGALFDRYTTWAIGEQEKKPFRRKGFAIHLRERFRYRMLDGRPIYLGLRVKRA